MEKIHKLNQKYDISTDPHWLLVSQQTLCVQGHMEHHQHNWASIYLLHHLLLPCSFCEKP